MEAAATEGLWKAIFVQANVEYSDTVEKRHIAVREQKSPEFGAYSPH
jgi:hypothetical protein